MVLQTGSSASLHVQGGAVEGWRAVLTVVLRYGAAQRQRIGLSRVSSERRAEAFSSSMTGMAQPAEAPAEVSEVEAIVAGVKSHGVSFFVQARLDTSYTE